jgi:ankyrin repeat protein
MMRLLLKAGAHQVINDFEVPLALALVSGHESMALELSRGSNLNARIGKGRETILELACGAKLFTVARYLFDRGAATHPDDQATACYTIALFHLLKATACKGEFGQTGTPRRCV